jgi:predicted Zn-dependent peptidase
VLVEGGSVLMRSLLWAVILISAGLARGQSLQEFEKKVSEFTLTNGLHFIVIERHNAPVASFFTYVNAGSVDDPKGHTGLAHMFEHMAFKGTPTIGTKNWTLEKSALAEIEKVYDQLERERSKGPRADKQKLEALEKQMEAVIEKADSFIEPNEFDRVVEENGGVGTNAGTTMDSTTYYMNFPSNRLELWFLLESSRFRTPVFREFYKERDVVREERRMRVESEPQGKLMEALLAAAFAAHPYRNMPGGWASDIEQFRQPEAMEFFRRYYVPSNITIAIAGDVDPKQVRALAEKYFGPWKGGPPPEPIRTIEPPQEGEKRIAVAAQSQPLMMIGWHRPNELSPDDAPLEVLDDILSGGRTSIFYKELIRDRQLALAAVAESTFPGGKYPSLFLVLIAPNRGKTLEECEKAVYDIIDRLKTKPVDQATLDRVKTKIRADLIRKLNSNSGLAAELATYHAVYGDWRKLFTSLQDIEKVTAADVQRVARTYFTKANRTVAWTESPDPAPAKPETTATKSEGSEVKQ